MHDGPAQGVEDLSAFNPEVMRAFRHAVRDELIAHKRDGDPIVVWENGKVVEIPADQIVIPDLDTKD